jgi:hypothetical protein|tara:strand:+ start:56 stop:418 length:363 start_codon:yes stop_codon:yes gene_type:complete
MPTFAKQELSGSTDGRGIKVTGNATGASVTVHQAQSGTGDNNYDEVFVYANNSSTAAILLTIEFGGVTVPDDLIEVSVPAQQGLMLVVPGLVLQNSLYVKAWASVINEVSLFGFVNKVTA